MQQVNTPSQQPTNPFDRTPPNKQNQSRSPRVQMGEIDLLYQKISLLQNENKMLKVQLEQANGTIKQLNAKTNASPTQSLLKTTTFELVVLQKAVEQLEQLKQALLRRRNNPQQTEGTLQTEETVDMVSELRSRLLETQFKQEGSDIQVREGRRQQSDTQIRSPMRKIKQKGSPSNPYRSKHDSTIE